MRDHPVRPGDPEQAPERYLVMARLFNDEQPICTPELRHKHRRIYRTFLRELRAETNWIVTQYSNHSAKATDSGVLAFRAAMARNTRRLWWAWVLHGLGSAAGGPLAQATVTSTVRLLATMRPAVLSFAVQEMPLPHR